MSKKIDVIPKSWNSIYVLDIPMIDKQHIKFFRIFDSLQLLSNQENNYEALNEVITTLEKYTNLHFKTEEALMRKANSPDYEIHIAQHEIFINKVSEFRTAYNYKNLVLLNQMLVFIRKWFLMHISEVDAKYADSVHQFMIDKGWESKLEIE